MANPQFRDRNGNNEYTWEELPIIPSDRADITEPINTDRALLEFKHANIIIGTKILTSRGKWSLRFRAITKSMVLSLQAFFELADFRFIPDADSPGTFKEVYINNDFDPRWQSGGRYDLTLELKEYS